MSKAGCDMSASFPLGKCDFYVMHLRKIRIVYVVCCNLNLCVFLE